MKKSELIFTAILVPIDFLMLVLAGLAAYSLRFSAFVSEIRPVIFNLPFGEYFKVVFFVAAIWIAVFAFSGLYSSKRGKRIFDEFSRIFSACTVGIMLVLLAIFASRELFDSRFIVLAGWGFSFIFVFWGRFFITLVQRNLYKKGIGAHNLVIVGDDGATKHINELFKEKSSFGYKVIEVIKDNSEEAILKIKQLAERERVDEILQGENFSSEASSLLVDFCNENHIVYKYIPNLFETKAINVDIQDIAGVPIIELRKTPLDGWGKIFKRIIDILGGVMGIIIFSPLMIVIAIAIKLDSKGPVFFGYKRIGQYGKPFFYFKFRSMVDGAHKMRYDAEFRKNIEDTRGWNDDNPMVKYKNDPRITKAGKFLRKTSLDELAEFFNVFIGKMSLVGPRPHEPEEVAKYKNHHKKLLTIKPGITGLSQISGRSDLTFEEEVKLDTYYIENWSPKFDVYILFKTPLILFKKRKAE